MLVLFVLTVPMRNGNYVDEMETVHMDKFLPYL